MEGKFLTIQSSRKETEGLLINNAGKKNIKALYIMYILDGERKNKLIKQHDLIP
jgi:hypothetical protein